MNKKSNYIRLLVLLLCTIFLFGCSTSGLTQQEDGTPSAAIDQSSTVADTDAQTLITQLVNYDKEDFYTDWKNENPNYIDLNQAETKDGKITISKAGVYVLSGKLTEGQVVVDTEDKESVRLVLNGVEINSSDNAPIYIVNAEKVIISLEKGTENKISDGKTYKLEDASTDEPNAAIFSKTDLVINGEGTLTVQGNYNNGITSKDDLIVTGGNLHINAVDDGLMGKDMVAIKDGSIVIEAGGDGIKSTNDTDSSKGFVAIEGGSLNITSGADGIQTETSLLVSGGTYSILSGGGSANAAVKTEERGGQGPMGNMDGLTGATTTTTAETETQSAKGLKAKTAIVVSGGTFKIDTADDAIHSNDTAIITGGAFDIASGDDGFHADTSILIADGTMNITKSYEGIESADITINGGEIHVTASDDGINISGGNDQSALNGRPGQNSFSTSDSSLLSINGGYIVVDSNGDGLDSNGSIAMSGGTVLVSGPTGNNNGALDYDGTFAMTGGFLIAAGSSGMAQAPSDASTQNALLMYYPSVQKAGTLLNLQDSTGKTIATFAPQKDYQSVVISSPELQKGSSYTLYSGGSSTGTAKDNLYNGGTYQKGTKIVEFSMADTITWLTDTGITTQRSSGPGGGNQGGNPGFGGDKGQTRPERQNTNN